MSNNSPSIFLRMAPMTMLTEAQSDTQQGIERLPSVAVAASVCPRVQRTEITSIKAIFDCKNSNIIHAEPPAKQSSRRSSSHRIPPRHSGAKYRINDGFARRRTNRHGVSCCYGICTTTVITATTQQRHRQSRDTFPSPTANFNTTEQSSQENTVHSSISNDHGSSNVASFEEQGSGVPTTSAMNVVDALIQTW